MLTLTPPVVPMLARVSALEGAMHALPDNVKLAIEPVHRFAQGLYAREVTLPAGSVAVGHQHTQEHICIISKGIVRVVSDDGTREIAAPATMIMPAGTKNCVYALTDTVWTTIHATELTDVAEIEAVMTIGDTKWLS